MQVDPEAIHSYVYSREIVALVKASHTAAAFLEEIRTKDATDFLAEAPRVLTAVYAAILETGDTEPLSDAGTEPVVTEQDWAAVYKQIAGILGVHNEFLRPAGKDEFDRSELVTHTISEDLADVYQELKDFSAGYSTGMEEIMNDAAWELKQRFAAHWGKKLLRALLAIHEISSTRNEIDIE